MSARLVNALARETRGLRPTPRGRRLLVAVPWVGVMVGLLVATGVIAGLMALGAPGAVAGNGAVASAVAPAAAVEVVARPGDTLWGLARRHAPDQDPRAVLTRMERPGGGTGVLRPGEVVMIPID